MTVKELRDKLGELVVEGHGDDQALFLDANFNWHMIKHITPGSWRTKPCHCLSEIEVII